MPLSIVEQVLTSVFKNKNITQVDFCWLTGEPLVMGIDYYESIISLCDNLKPNTVITSFTIQTNGTLINDRWVSFFKKHNFVVGVSIDGPKEIHDSQRNNKQGKGSFEKTLNGINLLTEGGIGGGALCVITKKTLDYPADILFNFFHERKIAWSYLIEARIGENFLSKNSLSRNDIPRLRIFLNRLINLWEKHPGSFIRDFDFLSKKLMMDLSSPEVTFNNLGCLDILMSPQKVISIGVILN